MQRRLPVNYLGLSKATSLNNRSLQTTWDSRKIHNRREQTQYIRSLLQMTSHRRDVILCCLSLTSCSNPMVSSSPPPLREGYVFAASGTSLIDAPADFVWSTILEFQSYKHWSAYLFDGSLYYSPFSLKGTHLCETIFKQIDDRCWN